MKKSKILKIVFLILLAGLFTGASAGLLLFVVEDLPEIQSLETFSHSAITRIYSSDSVLLAELFAEKRDPVRLNMVPQKLVQALIATEDRNFYRHSGIDLKGIARALYRDVKAFSFVEGASTLTQQLAKTLFLTPEKSVTRKIKEALLAVQLERRYTKNEILELYLNQVYFGSGAYGVESASQVFFGKPVDKLTLAECALLAGMPKAPSYYSPLVNITRAKKRRDTVLHQMAQVGSISKEESAIAVKSPIILNQQNRKDTKAPYYISYLKNQLEEKFGEDSLYKDGLTVYTTLSFSLQKVAENAVAQGLLALDKRIKKNGGITSPEPQAALVSMDTLSGAILAMVGGRDYYQSPFNRAVFAKRQPGSAFKPMVFACAIEQGIPQNKRLEDSPVVYRGANKGRDWKPQNFSKTFKGSVTMRQALSESRNIPSIGLLEMLGIASVIDFSHNLGIHSYLNHNLSLALGSSSVSLMELTSAYGVFPNEGKWVEPFGLLEVHDRKGRLIYRHKKRTKMVMSRAGAAVMTDMLQTVIEEGTGKSANFIRRPLGGKTGTTDDCKDAWFIGFSPGIVTGVWVGRDRMISLGKHETGARAALPIWIQYMETAVLRDEYRYFDIPDDVVQMPIDRVSGKPLKNPDSDASTFLFIKGTEP